MPIPKDIDDAYLQAQPVEDVLIPSGRYRARAHAAECVRAATGSHGLRVWLVILDGACKGNVLRDDQWLTGGAFPISKRNLDLLGFKGFSPSQIEAFRDFARLPSVLVRVESREYNGRSFPEVTAILPDRESQGSSPGSERVASPSTGEDSQTPQGNARQS